MKFFLINGCSLKFSISFLSKLGPQYAFAILFTNFDVLLNPSFEIMAAYAAPMDKFSSPGPGGIYKFLTNFCSDKTLLAFTLFATPPEKIK